MKKINTIILESILLIFLARADRVMWTKGVIYYNLIIQMYIESGHICEESTISAF